MSTKDILIIEKRNTITDLKYKSYLFIDLCRDFSEEDVLRNLLRWRNKFFYQTAKARLQQIQIRFPFKWKKLGSKLQQFDYHPGLYVIEKKPNGPYALPKDIRNIHDALQIKLYLAEQQRIHFQFNSIFFDDPKKFRYQEYLGDFQKKINSKEGILYGLYCGETMVGFIGLETDNSGVYVNELFVEKKYRSQGFGKILMQAGFHYIATTRHQNIWTTLAVQNSRGLGFYKSCGFREIAQINFMNL